jgi:hypothetical protein
MSLSCPHPILLPPSIEELTRIPRGAVQVMALSKKVVEPIGALVQAVGKRVRLPAPGALRAVLVSDDVEFTAAALQSELELTLDTIDLGDVLSKTVVWGTAEEPCAALVIHTSLARSLKADLPGARAFLAGEVGRAHDLSVRQARRHTNWRTAIDVMDLGLAEIAWEAFYAGSVAGLWSDNAGLGQETWATRLACKEARKRILVIGNDRFLGDVAIRAADHYLRSVCYTLGLIHGMYGDDAAAESAVAALAEIAPPGFGHTIRSLMDALVWRSECRGTRHNRDAYPHVRDALTHLFDPIGVLVWEDGGMLRFQRADVMKVMARHMAEAQRNKDVDGGPMVMSPFHALGMRLAGFSAFALLAIALPMLASLV